jgi:hypothetical protein
MMKQICAISVLLQPSVNESSTYKRHMSNKVHKCSQLGLALQLFKADNPKRFRSNLHVSPETFDGLFHAIEKHPIFQSDGSASQFPVEWQLAITLYCIGHYKNVASVEKVAHWAGVSVGMVVNATQQVIIAFLAMHDKVIHWPNAEKEEAKQWVEDTSCAAWRAGWLLVDRTLIPLAEKPTYYGEAYFDQKSNYSLNVQVCFLIHISMQPI